MRTRPRFLLLIGLAVLVLLGVLVSGAFRSTEPEYGGKKLSEWIAELPEDSSPDGVSRAEVAVRHIGTNAVPYLLNWIGYAPGALKMGYYRTVGRFVQHSTNGFVFQDRRILRAANAVKAFGVLGPAAPGARMELTRMLNEKGHGPGAGCISLALMYCTKTNSNRHFHDTELVTFNSRDVFTLRYDSKSRPVLSVSPNTNISPYVSSMSGVGVSTPVRK